jgi:hypothetical protein
MRGKKNNLLNLVLPFFLFLTLSIPSLKIIFISSELVNVVSILGLFFIGALRALDTKKLPFLIGEGRKRLLSLLMLFWFMLILSSFISSHIALSVIELSQYLSIIIAFSAILLFIEGKDIKKLFVFQFGWGLFLAILSILDLITLDRSDGQNYLVLGVPLAIALLLSVALFFTKDWWLYKAAGILGVIITVGALSQLDGRAPLLFPMILIVAYVIYYNWKNGNFYWIFGTAGAFIVFVLGAFLLAPESRIDRMMRLFTNIDEEPRIEIYAYYLEKSFDNVFGYGLKAWSNESAGGYPHNFFLEVMFSTGLLGLLVSIIITVLFLIFSWFLIRDWGDQFLAVGSVFLVLYLFMTWNVSFELSGTYMLFSAIAVVAVVCFEFKNKRLNHADSYNTINRLK